ncbi:hypothetical protein ACOME3_008187 [Neoechinorhynchus agilis]
MKLTSLTIIIVLIFPVQLSALSMEKGNRTKIVDVTEAPKEIPSDADLKDIICNVYLPPAIANTTDNLGMVVYYQDLEVKNIKIQVMENYASTFRFSNHLSCQNLDNYRLCLMLLTKSPNGTVDLGNNDAVMSVSCTEIEETLSEVKPAFSLFLYVLCVVFVIPLIIRDHTINRTARQKGLKEKANVRQNRWSVLWHVPKRKFQLDNPMDRFAAPSIVCKCQVVSENKERTESRLKDECSARGNENDRYCDPVDAVVANILKDVPWGKSH